MIKANELRIGNFVTIFDRVAIIDTDWFTNIKPSREGPSMLEVTKPIPLTPEILTEWYGFEKHEKGFSNDCFSLPDTRLSLCGHRFRLHYYEFSGDASLNGFYFDAGHPYDTHVKHLHHLQNLIHALTGLELEIKVFVS